MLPIGEPIVKGKVAYRDNAPNWLRAHTVPMRKPPHYLREWRERAGITQEALAERIGKQKHTISRIENFKRPYVQGTWEDIAHALGLDPADLFHPPPNDGLVSQLNHDLRQLSEQDLSLVADLARNLALRDKRKRA